MSEKKPAKQRATKTAKAAPAKRAAKRKPKVRVRALVDAPPDRSFWVNCGPVLKNLRELHAALAHSVSEAQFAHHVGARRNDFADWVEAVLDDVTCAQALRRAKTRASAVRVVEKHLAAYA